MKSKECPECRALLVQASTVCARCGHTFDGVSRPPVPAPTWLAPEEFPPPVDGPPPVHAPPPPGEGGDPGPADAPPFAEPGSVAAYPPAAPGAGGPPPPGYGAPGYGAPGYGAPAYGAPGYAGQLPHPRATTAMVLGILALVLCGVLGIPAVVIGNNSLREIRAEPGRYSGEGSARAGVIMGWIAIGLLAVSLVAIVAIVALGSTTEPRFSQIGTPNPGEF